MALALPETTEGGKLQILDFRVHCKIFAALTEPGVVGLRCAPANLDALVSADPATFSNLSHGRWVAVRLDRISKPALQELMADAWRLAAPKRLAKAAARLP
jgi:hypothetical protein